MACSLSCQFCGLVCLFVCFLWVGCRCVYLQLWGIGQYMVVCVCCSLLRLPYSLSAVSHFLSPSPAFFLLLLTQTFPKVLPAWLRDSAVFCTPGKYYIKKRISFSAVRWNHYLVFCALNVEGNPISKDFLPTRVHGLVCCPSCRSCCFVAL